MSRVVDWLDERMAVRQVLKFLLDEPVPGGARPRYVFGSVLVFLFMQQVVLGILLATYYSPSASDAWASTAYIQDRVSGGWILRGLHHHGSSAMVVVTILHTLQVVFAGAYRKPREINWWSGLAMGGLVLAFALTGYLLPWDQKGYWATKVATGIMGTVPGGEPLQTMVQGGDEYGNLTITRFYALHVFVLPIALSSLLGVHLWVFRKHGVTPPASLDKAQLERKKQPFWPNQLFIDMLAMALTAGVLMWLTITTHGAELFAPADPASTFVARPEWYFLFLFQLLKYFEGPLTIVATVVLPGAATAFLVLLPFADRAASRRARDRWPVLSVLGLMLAAAVGLTAAAIAEDRANEDFGEGLALAHERAERARELALEGVPPEGGTAVWKNDPDYKAMALFEEHCSVCHTVGNRGSSDAPTLTAFSSRAWLRGAVREPESKRYFGGTDTHETMEAYSTEDLSDADLDAVVEYLVSLRGEEGDEFDAALAKKGAALWDEAEAADCSGCHYIEAGSDGEGAPVFEGRGSREWIARVIRDSSQKDLYGEDADMVKFDEKLSDEEIEMLAGYVFSQTAEDEDEEQEGRVPESK